MKLANCVYDLQWKRLFLEFIMHYKLIGKLNIYRLRDFETLIHITKSYIFCSNIVTIVVVFKKHDWIREEYLNNYSNYWRVIAKVVSSYFFVNY